MDKQKTMRVKSYSRSKPNRTKLKGKLRTKKKTTNKPKCIGCTVLLSTNTKFFAY